MQSIDEIIRLREEAIQKLLAEKAGMQTEMERLAARLTEIGDQLQRLGYSTTPVARVHDRPAGVPRKRSAIEADKQPEYTVEQHLAGKGPAIADLLHRLSTALRAFGEDVQETPRKNYIAYSTARNFCGIVVQASKLWVYIDIPNPELQDPRGIAEDCSSIGHWATGSTRIAVAPHGDLDYALSLIRQSYVWSRSQQ